MQKQFRTVAVIPARMGASRFPGKPLVKILDLPMIEHVRRRVSLCSCIDEVYVATCDEEIKRAVERYGGKAIMTADTHERCTDRVEEAIQDIDCDIVFIFQGDEPLFDLSVADKLLRPFIDHSQTLCSNLISTIKNEDDLRDMNIVKAVLDRRQRVLCFSRAALPYKRVGTACPLYRQTGLSAFKRDFLVQFSNLAPTPLEMRESIDFMRILEHGFAIQGVVFEQELFGVDEPRHIAIIEKILQENPTQKAIYEEIRVHV
ncbi:MAG: 3-deoxy-manno-octulosonate cytidylyltransferase [Candidatus Omnitrophica bacterium]|nr:3-deoxy-manno-octulosonate cytidylyltransferase [Candidatus Omnitrophota bacterium]